MSKVKEFNGQATENNGVVVDAEYKEVNQEQPQEGGAEAEANAEQPKPAANTAPKPEPKKEGFWRKVWKGAKKAFPYVVTGALCALGGTWLGKHLGLKTSDVVDATAKVVQDTAQAQAPAALEAVAPKALETVAETAQDVVQSLTTE